MRWCSINPRDLLILKKIVEYCDRIDNNLVRYEHNRKAFEEDYLFQDACCMCIVQIGELVALLSDEVKQQNQSIPWRAIKDTRNFYVHNYGSIDINTVWETLNKDIPVLKQACKELLK